jgi:hypothetical protein
MDGAYQAFVTKFGADVVEDFARKHREDCQLRLAKIANGKHPAYQKGSKVKTIEDR